MKKPLYELTLPTDRWSTRVVSPTDIRDGIDPQCHGEVVILHPGWAKSPKRHVQLLTRLAIGGYCAIGIDTRYGYSDRQLPRKRLVTQPMLVGNDNPYFDGAQTSDNRWRYRRPTVMLDVCERLGIGVRSYIGHSEGGRISTLATVADPEKVKKLIIVNGAGTGNSSNGLVRMGHSNLNRLADMARNRSELVEATASGLGSTAYTLTHLRRTLAEKQVIQSADTWELLDRLEPTGIDVTVMHATNDELISYEDAEANAAKRPWINFTPTPGNHSNIYEQHLHQQILQSLS